MSKDTEPHFKNEARFTTTHEDAIAKLCNKTDEHHEVIAALIDQVKNLHEVVTRLVEELR